MGHVHHRDDDADRAAHGPLPAPLASGQGARNLRRSAFVLVLLAIWGGQLGVAHSSRSARYFTLRAPTLAVLIIIYGFAASALPVWLLLAPRDYLSTFVKLGDRHAGARHHCVRPTLHMPPLTRFIDGTGPVFAGKIVSLCFITIACGAISGFHSLISTGTTPKLIARETRNAHGRLRRDDGCESLVAIMAMIAACVLQPGIIFRGQQSRRHRRRTPEAAAATISNWGFPVTAADMQALAQAVGEQTLFNRTGGAPASLSAWRTSFRTASAARR